MKRTLLSLLSILLLTLAGGCARKKQAVVDGDLTRPPEKWLEMEPVRLLHEYIRIDTTQKSGEQRGAEFLKRLLDCDGIETEIVCPEPRRCNLLARLPGRQREGALLLLNHIDVAPTDPKGWSEFGPFEGGIKHGYLYGRGAYDMKSLALAQLLALRNLRERGIVPEADILFLAEADEETGHRWGAPWLLANRPEWFQGVAAVVNEGGTVEVILREPRFWGIETVQAGYATAEFEASTPTALQSLAEKWAKLNALPVEPHPHVRMGFDMLANHLVSPLTDPLRNLDRVRRDPVELAVLPDRYASFLVPRIYWFGPVPNVGGSPGSIALTVISTPPGINPTPYLEEVLQDSLRLGIKITLSFSGGVTSASPYPTPFTEVLRRVTGAQFPGVSFGPVPTFSAYTTSVSFREKGFPTYGYSSIPMNITDTIRRHANNERIYLRDYLSGVALFKEVLEEFAVNAVTPDLSPERLKK